jgi:histidine ammonia-lyase
MHAAQAIDLRKLKNPGLKLGEGTEEEFHSFRVVVPFLDKDRVLNLDIEKAYQYVRQKVLAP